MLLTSTGTPVIPITKRDGSVFYCLLDREDYRAASQHLWHLAGGKNVGTYATTSALGYMHRWVARRSGVLTNASPPGTEIDHINGDHLDNRRSNLRLVKHAVNTRNTNDGLRGNNRSGYRGVSFVKMRERWGKPWMAYVQVDHKSKNLGWYATAEEAAAARRAWDQRGEVPSLSE